MGREEEGREMTRLERGWLWVGFVVLLVPLGIFCLIGIAFLYLAYLVSAPFEILIDENHRVVNWGEFMGWK